MSLTAKEWLLLPEDEQIRRANEVPPHECFLLRVMQRFILQKSKKQI